MKMTVLVSIVVSIALVGFAGWTRYVDKQTVDSNPELVPTIRVFNTDTYNTPNSLAQGSTTQDTSITQVNYLGRQLLSEYVNLAANGNVSEAVIASLAEKYVVKIEEIGKKIVVEPSQIKTVPDSKENFTAYDNTMTSIHGSAARVLKSKNINLSDLTYLNPKLNSFAETMAQVYIEMTDGLKAMSIPVSLMNLHISLINNYLGSAESLKAIKNVENDAALTFAGMITLKQNIENQKVIIGDINAKLNLNGI